MWIDYASVIRESEEQLRGLERKYRGNSRVAKRIQMVRLLKSGACCQRRWKNPHSGGLEFPT